MEKRTDCVTVQPWSWRGVTLSAGNGEVTARQLSAFLHEVMVKFGPDSVVRIEEYALRVYQGEGERDAMPRLRFDH